MGKIAFAAVWLLVFVIPLENQLSIPGMGTLSRIVGLGAMGAGILSLACGQRNLRLHAFHLAMLAFTVLGGISFFWSPDPENSQTRFLTYVQMLGMTWLIFQAGTTPRLVNALLMAYVAGASVALGSVFWNLGNAAEEVARISAKGFNPNDVAVILALGIPMGWYLAEVRWGGKLSWMFRLYPLIAPLGIFLTASRNGLLAVVITSIYPLFSLLRSSWSQKVVVGGMVALASTVGMTLIPEASLARLATFGDAVSGGMNMRQDIWMAGLRAFVENPLLGWGAGAFPATVEPYLGIAVSPHNVYLSILVEQGFTGFLFFVLILGTAFVSIKRMPPGEKFFWAVLLGTWCVCAFALNWEWRKQTWLLLVLVVTHATALMAQNTESAEGRA